MAVGEGSHGTGWRSQGSGWEVYGIMWGSHWDGWGSNGTGWGPSPGAHWKDGGPIAPVGFPRHRLGSQPWGSLEGWGSHRTGGVPRGTGWGVPAPMGLTGGMAVPAVTVQEPVAEAAAAAEVSRGTAGFPGATEPWRVTSHQPEGQEVPSGCPIPTVPGMCPCPPPQGC